MTAGSGGGRFTRAGFVICAACQAENPATNRFCDRCGTRIGISTRSPVRKPDTQPPVSVPPALDDATFLAVRIEDQAPPAGTPPAAAMHDAAPPAINQPPIAPQGPRPAVDPVTVPTAADTASEAPRGQAYPAQQPERKGIGAPATHRPVVHPAATSAAAASPDPAPTTTNVPGMTTPYAAPGSGRTLAILVGIPVALLGLCVALWVVLAFLGAISFSVGGPAVATGVATIVATRAP